ncbi:MAG: hypothetical protein JSS87_01550 [Acidobacteria bacterium]|nr:hypothetical protein [Acidobacteriota bacterium]
MPSAVFAQDAPATASAAARQLGTVKSVSGDTLSIATDKGASFSVQVDPAAKIVLLAPGSTDLKTATPSSFDNIAVGDRVLASGKTGDTPTTIHATRIVVMKSADIAQRNAQLQADWQKRGSGGIVSAVDPANGDITIKSGARTITLKTTPKTIFRRYSSGSVKYEDARNSTLQEIAVGDQLRVRGEHSEDGSTITADEVVSGSFSNVAGTIVSVDAPGQTIVVKDLAKKKNVTVHLSAATNIRTLPAEIATRLAARTRGAGARAGTPAENGAAHPAAEAPSAGSGEGMHRGPGATGGRSRDLSQIIASLPSQTLADLKPGEALMIVGSQSAPSEPLTAITVLSGVEPILAAAPSGSNAMTLSPWNLDSSAGGGGGPDMGGSGGSQQ